MQTVGEVVRGAVGEAAAEAVGCKGSIAEERVHSGSQREHSGREHSRRERGTEHSRRERESSRGNGKDEREHR